MDRMDEYRRAFGIFEDWLAARGQGGGPAAEELLAAHPELAEILEGMLLSEFSGAEDTEDAKDPKNTEGAEDAGQDPELIGSYRLEGVLGQGGMGTVYRARHQTLDRVVALKVIRDERLWSSVARLRFRREAQAVARLDDPGICPVYEVGEERGQPYMAMRLVEGQSLGEYLDAQRSGEDSLLGSGLRSRIDELIRLFARVARSLQTAHEQGIVHRDLKPANLIVTPQRDPVILDFGLAQVADAEIQALTMTGDQPGTPMYMAPEQIDPRGRTPDASCDCWALGVCLYEALAGCRPFDGESLREIQDAILERDPAPLQRVDRRIPDDLIAIVEKALEKDRSRRYRTAGDLAQDLERYLRREPVRARRIGRILRVRRWVQRNPLAASFLLAVSIALISISWLLLDNRELLREYDLLAWGKRLENAVQAEALLYPVRPERRARFEGWLERHGEAIAQALPELERSLLELRERGQRIESPDTASEHDLSPLRFSAPTDQFRHDNLLELVRAARRFVAADGGMLARVRTHLAWLDEVEALSVRGATELWDRAAEELRADPRFAGCELKPQVGLIPIGLDPETGLQEFAHLRSGEAPARDAVTRRLLFGPETGIVFVLLPGGRTHVGAQREDPQAANFDAGARSNEGPVQELRLAPFFIAKHEMTQGQWQRLSFGSRPSSARAGKSYAGIRIDGTHPVENISWSEAHELLRRHGLRLPTEAQWEYACRGGTSSAWSTGAEHGSLEGYVNFADQTAKRKGAAWTQIAAWPELDDGYTLHAPVLSMRANPFGLHHVHGNLFEWCEDLFARYELAEPRGGDGLREPPDATMRVIRGGSFDTSFAQARSAYRRSESPRARGGNIGLRPARELRP
jgi:serine/threonine protein kinase/formylglycine-generating enzyme required for sulfatase activity